MRGRGREGGSGETVELRFGESLREKTEYCYCTVYSSGMLILLQSSCDFESQVKMWDSCPEMGGERVVMEDWERERINSNQLV